MTRIYALFVVNRILFSKHIKFVAPSTFHQFVEFSIWSHYKIHPNLGQRVFFSHNSVTVLDRAYRFKDVAEGHKGEVRMLKYKF